MTRTLIAIVHRLLTEYRYLPRQQRHPNSDCIDTTLARAPALTPIPHNGLKAAVLLCNFTTVEYTFQRNNY